MKPLTVDYDRNDTTSVIHELASVADRAMVKGDYSRVVAIVENIYELLDRHSDAAAQPPGAGPC